MKMLRCIFLALAIILTAVVDNEANEATPWPPSCCENKLGCDADTLSQYCVCPELCVDVGKCPCKFPGTDEIINPRSYKYFPIPPFCSCPVAKCFVEECPANIAICTGEAVQHLVNE